ncbi:unnamed protein product, partial [Medioppia subpectinata]
KPNTSFEPIVGQTLHYTVGAIVFDDRTGDVLLIQESKAKCRGLWTWPAGKAEPREPLLEAVRREVREESGYDIAVTALVVIDSESNAGRGKGMKFRFTFAGRVVGGQLKTLEDRESIRAKWFTRPELLAMDNFRRDGTVDLINTVWVSERPALQNVPPVAIRAHNQMLMRIVLTVVKETNRGMIPRYVLVSRRPHPHLPVCALRRKSHPNTILDMFIKQVFGSNDMCQHSPSGVLSIEHNGVPVPAHDGLCLTVLVKCRVPYDKAVPAGDGYVWQPVSQRLDKQLQTYLESPEITLIEWSAE